jgi:Fe2+ or Zn2+ uptake regulation protein
VTDAPPVPEAIADTPPSRKLVWLALATTDAECLTAAELLERLAVGQGTVYESLEELNDAGVVESRPCPNAPETSLHHAALQS